MHILARHRTRQIPGAFIIFYTLVDDELRAAMEAFVTSARECESDPARKIIAVDVLAQAHDALAEATGRTPEPHPGALYSIDDQYFSRLAAVDFTINHDDGRNPQDLTKADIVLIGVSRTSKTPLSIYLSQLGYKVANVPLDKSDRTTKGALRGRSYAYLRSYDHRLSSWSRFANAVSLRQSMLLRPIQNTKQSAKSSLLHVI